MAEGQIILRVHSVHREIWNQLRDAFNLSRQLIQAIRWLDSADPFTKLGLVTTLKSNYLTSQDTVLHFSDFSLCNLMY